MNSALIAEAGSWIGEHHFKDPYSRELEISPSSATVTSILQGTFLRLDYTWACQGTSHEGTMLLGSDEGLTAYWADTYHMGREVMKMKGTWHDQTLRLEGSYPAGEGPDWGWIIELDPGLEMRMFNVAPGEEPEQFVTATFRRP